MPAKKKAAPTTFIDKSVRDITVHSISDKRSEGLATLAIAAAEYARGITAHADALSEIAKAFAVSAPAPIGLQINQAKD